VLGIDLQQQPKTDQQSIGPYVELALDLRRKLRDLKQWTLADEVRDRLAELGVVVEDQPGGGSTWRIER
jgi:cysteinyl-tRNA synthetase